MNAIASSPKKLLGPDQHKTALERRCENQYRHWFVGEGAWPLTFSLGPPTEDDAMGHPAAVREWAAAWTVYAGPGTVTWEDRTWPRRGKERIPVSIGYADPRVVFAALLMAARWDRATAHAACLVERWPQLKDCAALGRHFDELAGCSTADMQRLLALLAWLRAHPGSGLFLRQIPLEGVDTKWFEARKTIVLSMMAAITGADPGLDLYAVCGLKRPGFRLRMRILCPALRRQLAGLGDIESPLDELAGMSLRPRRVLVIENQQTALALPDLEGTVVFMRLGKAVTTLAGISWIRDADVLYWGDIDTHGFDCLDSARSVLPQLRSILMDRDTLLGHRALWVEEPVQEAATLEHLVPAELALLDELRGGTHGKLVRLEQERLALDECLVHIRKAFGIA